MNEINDFMSGDHGVIDALVERFRAGGDPPALSAFADALERHIGWEERLIFPVFARSVGGEALPSIETMETQHEELARAIAALRACPAGDAVLRRNLLAVFAEALADHNWSEETYVYPWIDGALGAAEKDALLRELRASAVSLQGGSHEPVRRS